ncbi:UNVERIFIED_CONTAM: hypothetical protein Slati_3101600 [Sesamum latifolium]|uniref:Uncharacterized protein n=1 Tax=Sesamum latifolium TaxID=2727402 RepID=A0AAW2UVG3_9LAMI
MEMPSNPPNKQKAGEAPAAAATQALQVVLNAPDFPIMIDYDSNAWVNRLGH